ncbi:glycosyltransferase [Fuerstiella marisgermanici]|uniref:Glycosyltransferase EpsD n=1 Tax=Fuerstiella marisgermanici TaxID=1891926 RepID=A0A1P8WI17_9PLAN|nr:glycosyltransferase [Fuerstiella marisgermanici]APZ93706.1 Putative glycosyltransferase EpsD [Fuerstiella marisgermanici]
MLQAAPTTQPSNTTDTHPTICHVIHALGVGGAEVLVDVMVRRMSDRYRCVIAVLDEIGPIGERLRADGFVVEHLHRQPGIDRGCARRLHAFADQHGAEIFHAHQYTPFFQAMLSRGLTGSRPVLFTEHGRHFPDAPSRKRSIVNRLLLRKQDRLVGVGGAVRQALIDNEGLPPSRCEVVYNGVDLDDLASAADDARIRIRQEFGFAADDFVAVQVARLHELKDHQTALKAIDEARQTAPNIRLLIVGDGDERAAIEQTIAQLNLADHIKLAGTRSDIADLLAASDAFLLSSISEGIPLTIIEAMAACLPVVSTAVGGIPEMITQGNSGFLADARDHAALAASLVQLQQSPALCLSVGSEGRAVAHRTFSLAGMLNAYGRMYEEMLHAR